MDNKLNSVGASSNVESSKLPSSENPGSNLASVNNSEIISALVTDPSSGPVGIECVPKSSAVGTEPVIKGGGSVSSEQSCAQSEASIGAGEGSSSGQGSSCQQQLRGSPTDSQQSHSQPMERGGLSYLEMLDVVKELHNNADRIQERVCKLHCDFADAVLKASLVFDPETVQILGQVSGLEMSHPDEEHFLRQEVDEYYEHLSQRVRPNDLQSTPTEFE